MTLEPQGVVVVVGGINQDVVVRAERRPGAGETVVGDGPAVVPGGKGANTAVAAARAGASVVMCGAVGDDDAGRAQVVALAAEHVDTRGVRERVGTATGVAMIVVTPDGENSIAVGRGANATVTGPDVRRACAGAAVVLAQTEVGAEPADWAAAACAGRFVLSLAPVLPLRAETLALADPVVLNETEAAEVVGRAADDPAAAVLAATGARAVVVTLGARGAAWADGASSGRVAGHLVAADDVVDTTGAGDCFTGTLAARLAAGDSLELAVTVAVAAAAESVRRPGARRPGLSDGGQSGTP
ncbi:PfkB family carbohydrate kinase [Nocardioides plantarum]|uniref:Ribokinase n=1 Tax=Nocardioides plantarum TaxID=29299 RepID=A0ABV5KC67_9ACTN|nr:PfkB family carbohydrate kinase [Nocardioides plantarum]